MFNWFTQILVMEAINTRLTCKLMSVSHQHNKKKNAKQIQNSIPTPNNSCIGFEKFYQWKRWEDSYAPNHLKSFWQWYNTLFKFSTMNSHLNRHQRKYFQKGSFSSHSSHLLPCSRWRVLTYMDKYQTI